jgi:hypothetical protein
VGPSFQTSHPNAANSNRAWRVFGGDQVNRYFDPEAAFFDPGQFSYQSTLALLPLGSIRGNFKLQGGGIDAVGTLPPNDTVAVLGRAGLQPDRRVDVELSGTR